MKRTLLFAAALSLSATVSAQNLGDYAVRYAFDAGARLTQFTVNGTTTIRYDYDTAGNRTGTTTGQTSLVDVEPPAEVAKAFRLHPAYPNPFNPSTVVRFDLPSESQVILSVYDLLGREVARLASRRMDAGSHQVSWDASGVGTGTYIIRISAGGRASATPVVLVR